MERDRQLEEYLVDMAARAGGHPGDGGVLAFAASRALPGPVHLPRDFTREIAEEVADGVNYCCWAIQEIHARVLAGDPDVMDAYERTMRTLVLLVGAWHALNTTST